MSPHATRARPPAVAAGDDEHWHGICRQDPDAWSGFDGRGKAPIARAAHLCGHCPVAKFCDQAAQRVPRTLRKGVVWAGVYYDFNTGLANPEDQPAATTCSICAPLQVHECARPGCPATFTQHPQGKARRYCCDRCQRWDWARNAREGDKAVLPRCPWCKVAFEPINREQRYCCTQCRWDANNAKREHTGKPPGRSNGTVLGGLKVSDLERAGVWEAT